MPMIWRIAFLVTILTIGAGSCAGCKTLCRAMNPITVDELDRVSRDMIEGKDVEIAKLEKAIADRSATATKWDWIFPAGAGVSIVLLFASIFVAITANLKIGIAGAFSSLGSALACTTFWKYGGPVALGGAILLGIIALGAVAFAVWKLVQSVKGMAKAIDKTEDDLSKAATTTGDGATCDPTAFVATLKANLSAIQSKTATAGTIKKIRGK